LVEQGQGLSLTVIKAMDILDCLGQAQAPLAASELGRRLGMPRSTAYRLLATLSAGGFVSQAMENPEKYRLGFKIVELAGSLLDTIELRQQAAPFLQELRDHANEVVHLVVLEQGRVAYIDKLECSQAVRMHSYVGRHGFAHCTAVGKAILAHLPEEDVAGIIGQHGLPAFTANTITDERALVEELAKVRQQGFAIDNLENEEGIRCVGAAIRNHEGQPVAAASVSGPSFRMTMERAEGLGPIVEKTTLEISRQLGYSERWVETGDSA
jgi:IclR family acetate operon transcriptional repressor